MGGRGSASGANLSPPSYLGETEKAVKLFIEVEYVHYERERAFQVWIPKSQLAPDGRPGEWITDQKMKDIDPSNMHGQKLFIGWRDSKGNTFQPSKTTNEIQAEKKRKKAFEAGQKSYNDLVEQAKKMGVKGVRVGMRRKTIEKKLKAFQS